MPLFDGWLSECLSPRFKSQTCPSRIHLGDAMSNSTELPDAVIGTAEPSSSRIMLVLLSVVAIGMFGLFSTIFGWDNIPVIGDIVPLMSNLGGSGIWYYLLGFIIGIGAIASTLAGEVISK